MTIGARMYRVEQQLSSMDRKMEQLVNAINNLTAQQQKLLPPQHYYHHSSGPLALPPAFDSFHYQQATAGMTAQQLQGLQLPPGPSQANTPVSSMLQPQLEDDV